MLERPARHALFVALPAPRSAALRFRGLTDRSLSANGFGHESGPLRIMYAVDVTAEPPEQILDHLMEAASTSLTPGRCPGSRSCGRSALRRQRGLLADITHWS
jgi:hypothetical protein